MKRIIPYLRLLSRRDSILVMVIAAMIFVTVIYPLSIMVYGTFKSAPPGEPSPLSLNNYVKMFAGDWFWEALGHTLWISVGGTVLGVFFGVSMGWIVVRTDTPWVSKLEIPMIVPFFLSPFIGALAWTGLASADYGLINGWFDAIFGIRPFEVFSPWGMIWVMGLYYSPYAFLIVSGTLRNMDPTLEEAALSSGANKFQTMIRITLPLMAPGIFASAILIFVAAAEQFGIPSVLGLNQRWFVLTTRIFYLLQEYPQDYSMAATVSMVMLLFTGGMVILRNRFIKRREFVTVAGKSFRPHVVQLGKWRYLTLGYLLGYIILAVILPFGTFVAISFFRFWSIHPKLKYLTLENWKYILFEYPTTWTAVMNSLFLSIVGAAVAVVITAVIAWVVVRTKAIGKDFLDTVATLPVAVPGLILGVAYMWAWLNAPIPIYGTIWILMVAYVSRFLPYSLRSIESTLRQIDKGLEESANISGASWIRTFFSISLPLLKPGLVAAYILLYVTFIRELSCSILLYSSGSEVLSVTMFDLWHDGMFPNLAAIGAMQLFITAATLFIFSRVFKVRITEVVK
ncbi:MAG: iron ABC transporter permease [Deltaproteobacteria bacterium]|nr:iron ABC transporter permease [Deltaproteobacteria bacterium]MBW2154696.1 iron ABC transporter permease [Deltaproteobacteria bacterium]